MADEKVKIGIELDEKDTAKVKTTLDDTFKKAGEESGKSFGSGLSSGLLSLKAVAVSIGAVIGGALSVGKLITAANQQEDAVRRLNTSLQITGKYSESASQGIQAYASELQKSTRFGDEAILENAALIQSLGKLEEDGLKRALRATTDLADGLGVDLATASTLVGKAASGNVDTFGRYGIAIQKGATANETFVNTLKAIETSFGGAAAANTKTFSGAIQQASNASGDLVEELGTLITSSPALRTAINLSTESTAKLTEKIKEFGQSQAFVDIQKDIVDTSIFLTKYLVGGFEVSFNIIRSLFDGLKVAFDGTLLLITQAFAITFNKLVENLPDFLKEKFPGLEQFREDLNNIAAGELTQFNDTVAITNENLDNLFSTEFSEGLVTNLETVRASLDQTTEGLKNMAVQSDKGEKSIKKDTFEIATAIRQVLAASIATGIQAITLSLIKGAFSFKDFTKQVLVVVGDMAIMLGKTAILTGIAMESLSELKGFKAIAAGIGLIALGTIVKSYAGGGGEAGASGGGGGGGGGGGNFDFAGTTPEQTAFTQFETEKEKTAVTVNIQGDVLDSEETGIKIVDLINQASSNSNVTINRRAFA